MEYFNTPGAPTEENPYWARWNQHSFWMSKTGLGKRQRLASYPANYPQPKEFIAGMSAADRNDPNNLNYYHKRNFTLFLSYPREGQNPDQQFEGQNFDSGKMNKPSRIDKDHPGPVIEDVPSPKVICAVNIMGQNRYAYAGGNALCTDGRRMQKSWDTKYNTPHAFR